MLNKKAAMFGLDARIALAIFGALSVISGAALYSAIQQANVERFNQYFVEMHKASDQYYLDNGKPLSQSDIDDVYGADIVLNRENLSTWNGPYVSATAANAVSLEDSMTKSIDPAAYFRYGLYKKSTWPNTTAWQLCTSNDVDCVQWGRLFSGNTASGHNALAAIFTPLDEKIDGGDGGAAGKVRFTLIGGTGNSYTLMYMGMPRQNLQ